MAEPGEVHELKVPRDALDRLDRISAGGDGGGFDGRLSRLEAHLERAQADLRELAADAKDTRERLIKIEEKVSHLPGKGFIVSVVLSCLALFAALAAFQDVIRAAIKASGSS